MIYALSWFAVILLLALWSLTVWMLHAVTVWSLSQAGLLSGSATGLGAVVLPDWLAPWVPAEAVQALTQMLSALGPLVDGLLQAVPALAGVVTVAAWGVWGLGALLLVLLGAGGHALIALGRRRKGGGRSDGGGTTGPRYAS